MTRESTLQEQKQHSKIDALIFRRVDTRFRFGRHVITDSSLRSLVSSLRCVLVSRLEQSFPWTG